MGIASIVFAWTTWRGADDALERAYGRIIAPDGVVSTWYPGDLPGWVPTTMSSAAAQTLAIVGYIVISQVAVQVGNSAWSAWNRAASAADLEWQKKRGLLGFFLEVQNGSVLEKAPPLRIQPNQLELLVDGTAGFGENALQHARHGQDRRTHVKSEALRIQHGGLTA